VYEQAFEIARTPDKQPISNKTDLLHHFKAYWNKLCKTLFLLEKLNEKDKETLQMIIYHGNQAHHVYITPPSKHLYAIKHSDNFIVQKHRLSTACLRTDNWAKLCEIPTFGGLVSNALSSGQSNLCLTALTEPKCYISYNPLEHNFTEYVTRIFRAPHQEEITNRVLHYPRLFEKFVNN
jgi:hypothetical protein